MSKKKTFVIGIVIIFILLMIGIVIGLSCMKHGKQAATQGTAEQIYYCPMHPNFTSDRPGSCGICGMTLVKKNSRESKAKTGKKKLLYYRNPMDPAVTSPVAMKDSMGMEYVPVYEEEQGGAGSGVYISSERQQLIGVKKEEVKNRKLNYQISTVGKVAYDPELYVAQEEYLQALKIAQSTKNSVLASISSQANSFLSAAENKLLLLGMNKESIQELAKRAKPEQNLYLPQNSDTVWVYLTVYEYEMGLVKEGAVVEIDAVAYPGEVFSGRITSIVPVLNSETRSVQARAEVKNTDSKLKPEMFVNAKLNIDLGEKLAVPETAVLDTGIRKIVYLAKEGDMLEAREVKLGQKAQGYYEVLEGLEAGEMVVTSGNFLVDSESKLKSALDN
jgi:membrane fusion protein, copper/silver efflux system